MSRRRVAHLGLVGGLIAALSFAGLAFSPPVAAAAAVSLGSLVPSGTGEALQSAAVSGDVVFSGAPDATLHVQDQGAVFVYAKPSSGWSGTQNEVAVLTAADADPGDRLGQSVTVAGSDVVVGSEAGKLYVFAEPARGWSGEVHESAVLTASDGARLISAVVSGQTIVAEATEGGASASAVYVFTEPTGGWSGTVHESAKLTASDGGPGEGFASSVAISGQTIAVGDRDAKVGGAYPGAVYVVTEPAGGWSGTLHETAKLTGSDVRNTCPLPIGPDLGQAVAISGDTVMALNPAAPCTGHDQGGAVYVFTEPSGGWRSETESAQLTAPDGYLFATPFPTPGDQLPGLQASGDTVVMSGSLRASSGDIGPSAVFVYTKPSAGWSGTLSETAKLVASDGGRLDTPTISGPSVIAGALRAVSDQTIIGPGPAYVFDEPAGGWSGTQSESAELADPSAAPPPGGPDEDLYTEPAGGWSSGPPSAMLLPSGDSRQVTYTGVAVSGPTAVASDDQGGVYIFDEPSGGWSTTEPAARLIDAGGDRLVGAPAISGSAVAAVAASPTGNSTVDLFSEPAAGWSGTVAQAAQLSPSDGVTIVRVAIAGQTVVAAGVKGTQEGTQGELYVFTEPPGGWSGAIHEAARLPLPQDVYPQSVSIDGPSVLVNGVISGSTAVSTMEAYVFSEPAGGWRGNVPVSATLIPGNNDPTARVYDEPADGWSGVVHPAARLLTSPTDVLSPELAISGETVAIDALPPGDHYDDPCTGGVWLFEKPAAGWAGTLTAPQFTTTTSSACDGNVALAVDQQVLFAGGGLIPMGDETSLDLFEIPAPVTEYSTRGGKPSAHTVRLSGLSRSRPALTFKLSAGIYASPIKSLTITPPRGLSFGVRRRLASRLLIGKQPAKPARVVRGKLVVDLTAAVDELRVTLRWPALLESRSLLKRIRRLGLAHQKRRKGQKLVLKAVLSVTDATGHNTRLALVAAVR